MTTEYIMSHTPRQIAEEHTAAEIERELKYAPLDEEQRNTAIASSDPHDWADTTGADMVSECERCLVEWYDEYNLEREYSAEDFAITATLFSALTLAEDDE